MLLRRVGISPLTGWARISYNHVFVCRPKYTIFHHLVGKCPLFDNPFSSFQIGDTSLHCAEMDEKVGNHKIWTNFDPTNLFGGTPKILKPVLDIPFQGLLLGKVWTMPWPLREWKIILLPQILIEYLHSTLCVGGGITRNPRDFLFQLKWWCTGNTTEFHVTYM